MKLPPEDYQAGGEHRCGLLLVSLYGTRDAASNWESELSGFLVNYGLVKGKASTCLFWSKDGNLTAAVHGDDITVEGSRQNVEALTAAVEAKYEIKVQMLGQDVDLLKEGKIINRSLRWTDRGIWWEADLRHASEVIRELGLT